MKLNLTTGYAVARKIIKADSEKGMTSMAMVRKKGIRLTRAELARLINAEMIKRGHDPMPMAQMERGVK